MAMRKTFGFVILTELFPAFALEVRPLSCAFVIRVCADSSCVRPRFYLNVRQVLFRLRRHEALIVLRLCDLHFVLRRQYPDLRLCLTPL